MADIDLTPLPIQIDRALEQTRRAGCTYAAVPLPWLIVWAQEALAREASRFYWWKCCIGRTDEPTDWGMEEGHYRLQLWGTHDACPQDENGNVLICLKERNHEGDCGYIWS